jgi:hypothetical protein
MKSRRPTGLPFTIPFAIPAYWTPEQALAVFELLDDLRCPIFGYYQNWLFDEIPRNRHPDIDRYYSTSIDNPAMYRDFAIPAYWTPEEAFALFQLLDDLHEQIWAIYSPDLRNMICKRYQSDKIIDLNPDNLPF